MAIRTLVWIGAGRPRSDYLSDGDVGRLEALGPVRFIVTAGRKFAPQDVIDESRQVQAVLTTWSSPAYTDEVLGGCGELRFLGRIGGSVRGIVGQSAWERGIAVVTAVDMQGRGMAEITLTLMLAGLHRLGHHLRRQAGQEILEHDGSNRGLQHAALQDCRVGLIGFGAIAQHVARRLAAFECRVAAYDPYVPDETLEALGVRRAGSVEALCEAADVVSVHAARLPQTRGILSAAAIDRLRPGAMVVNTAFYDLMDHDALERRVMAGEIHLALDDLDVLGPAQAQRIARLRTSPNCIITPVTFPNSACVAMMGRQVVDELECFVRGEPLRYAVARQSLATRG
ncbi:MAG: hypothetical protein GX591_14950 [Planctomycetes bacterium]|nr:hypothetical protein [Planctomycetota bacterium]